MFKVGWGDILVFQMNLKRFYPFLDDRICSSLTRWVLEQQIQINHYVLGSNWCLPKSVWTFESPLIRDNSKKKKIQKAQTRQPQAV